MPRTPRPPAGRASIGTGVALMALGGVLAFGVHAPAGLSRYVDLLDVGLVLVWSGVLVLAMQVVAHRPRRPRRSTWDDRTDQWFDRDVHRPGYAGQTRAMPTVRGDRTR